MILSFWHIFSLFCDAPKQSMQLLLIPVSGLAFCGTTVAPDYRASLIPDSLKTNANTVIREFAIDYTYRSETVNTIRYHTVITVLNKKGDNDAIYSQRYDKFRKLTDFKGAIYDSDGKLIRKIKNSEISDLTESAGYPEFVDDRYKYFRPLVSIYPFTVDYEFEVTISGSYYFPRWHAFYGYNVSICQTELNIRVPADYNLLYKQFNVSGLPVLRKEGDLIAYSWNAGNIKALDYEPYIGNIDQYVQAVYTSPSHFMLDGYPGSFNSWQDYALWQGRLNEGRDLLPENRAAEIRDLIKDARDDRTKVKILYSYLQGRTRYFSIQLGIGGYQPMDARVVDEAGYGDCKGLVNYMKALLKVAGIESWFTLVEADGNFPQIMADFPSDQFNHIILCVPLKQDTIWLECTSQNIPFGFLGDFTSDRQVLVIKDHGGELVKTPVYSLEENFQNTHARVTLTPEGNATAEISRKFGGLQFDDQLQNLHAGAEDQKEWLYRYIDLPNYKVGRYEMKQENPDIPESALNLSINISPYGTSSDKRLFLPVNLINRFEYTPPKLKKRWSQIEKLYSYVDTDSVEYLIPEGMALEFIPENTTIISPFGSYSTSVKAENNRVFFYRQVKMFKGKFPKEKYEELIKFYRDICNADKAQVILTKKDR
jgi:hypothetical protein